MKKVLITGGLALLMLLGYVALNSDRPPQFAESAYADANCKRPMRVRAELEIALGLKKVNLSGRLSKEETSLQGIVFEPEEMAYLLCMKSPKCDQAKAYWERYYTVLAFVPQQYLEFVQKWSPDCARWGQAEGAITVCPDKTDPPGRGAADECEIGGKCSTVNLAEVNIAEIGVNIFNTLNAPERAGWLNSMHSKRLDYTREGCMVLRAEFKTVNDGDHPWNGATIQANDAFNAVIKNPKSGKIGLLTVTRGSIVK